VESEVGQGSRFTISLACRLDEIAKLETLRTQTTLAADEKAEKSAMPSQVKPRGVVLLAEDNMANILTIGEYLKSHQYEVVIAHDGLEALKLAGDVNPDIILMDIQMPSMNGLEAIAHLRDDSRFAATPIIALTALAMPGDRERGLLAGATEYMSKPVSLRLLATTIKELLGKQV
jgi:CheY-like chemotaxis protein